MLVGCSVAIEHLLIQSDVVPDPAEFSLEANPAGVVRTRVDGIEGRTALGIRIVMVVLAHLASVIRRMGPTYTEVAGSVVMPSRRGIHQPSGIDLLDTGSQPIFRISINQLAPAFIVYHLERVKTRVTL